MTLYSADILDLAKPVSAAPAKKGRAKKAEIVPEPDVEEPVVVEEGKPKRVATEKQLAALAKAQETRRRKREEAVAAKEAEERVAREAAEREESETQALLAKKEAQKEKRRLAREAKKLATPPDSSTSSLEDTINRVVHGEDEEREAEEQPKPKRQKKTITTLDSTDNANPPVWFKQYVAGVKKEEAKVSKDKKPQRQIQEEAHQVAEHQWKDGFTRDRVRNEVDNHMSRMYHMMFSGRRLK